MKPKDGVDNSLVLPVICLSLKNASARNFFEKFKVNDKDNQTVNNEHLFNINSTNANKL